MSLSGNAELLALLDGRGDHYEIRVGGTKMSGAHGVVGAVAALKELLHGHPDGVRRAKIYNEVDVELVDTPNGPVVTIHYQDFTAICPGDAPEPPEPPKPLIVVNGNPMVERRRQPRGLL